jgi:Fibronectin type III domain
MAPTRSSFLARWRSVDGATGYRIDVSTDPLFNTYATGYEHRDAGNVTSLLVSRLSPGTKYYYRVQPYNSAGAGSNSESTAVATSTASGLVINPTFDSSITGNSQSAAIQSMINQAIALYSALFGDSVTAEILFRYSDKEPDGTPITSGAIAESRYVVYGVPWGAFIFNLKADAKTTNDTTANAGLPTTPLTPNLPPASANGRAVGLDTPPAMFADGSVGDGGPYDGIVTLNSSEPFQFSRPTSSGNYDARRLTEHEIDEVIGLGSFLGGPPPNSDFRPQDLFSWASPGVRNHTALGVRYFSINNGITNIIGFNQNSIGDYGDWLSGACPQTSPYVQNAFACKGQFSDITATSPEGVNLDVVGYDLTAAIPPPAPTILGNISTRTLVKIGDQVLIGGFIVTGTQPKKVIVRAIGPSLPLTGLLMNPFLELHDSSGALLVSNDNWRTDQEQEIMATGLAPSNDNESAIVMTLDPGSYTAIVSGVNGGTGIALVEVYDLDQLVDSKLANISTRGLVATGDNVLIGGFIVLGNNEANVLLRAVGPSLPLAGSLADPTMELHDSNGATLTSNDNWRSDQESEILATGLPPNDDSESAILTTLLPGSYTAIVRGANDTTGVALVEVYQLDN